MACESLCVLERLKIFIQVFNINKFKGGALAKLNAKLAAAEKAGAGTGAAAGGGGMSLMAKLKAKKAAGGESAASSATDGAGGDAAAPAAPKPKLKKGVSIYVQSDAIQARHPLEERKQKE